jgi:hypothetical protein
MKSFGRKFLRSGETETVGSSLILKQGFRLFMGKSFTFDICSSCLTQTFTV